MNVQFYNFYCLTPEILSSDTLCRVVEILTVLFIIIL